MKNIRLLLLCLVLVAAAGFPAARSGEARPTLPPEAAKVAEQFVSAFVRNDRPKIEALLPKKLPHRYGPSPFLRLPALAKPRADKRTGVIEFSGGRAEAGMPDRGMIMLRLVTTPDKRRVWRVRQIYWYDELPRDAQVPDKSPTAKDRQEEPRLQQAAAEFLRDWMAGKFEKLDAEVFHWWEVARKEPKWVKLRSVDFKPPARSLGGLRVDFTAKLRLLGALPKTVGGTLWLVEEDGQWRVRPLTVAFDF